MEHEMILLDADFKPVARMTAKRKDEAEKKSSDDADDSVQDDLSVCYAVRN